MYLSYGYGGYRYVTPKDDDGFMHYCTVGYSYITRSLRSGTGTGISVNIRVGAAEKRLQRKSTHDWRFASRPHAHGYCRGTATRLGSEFRWKLALSRGYQEQAR
jgi:hypothetical protein